MLMVCSHMFFFPAWRQRYRRYCLGSSECEEPRRLTMEKDGRVTGRLFTNSDWWMVCQTACMVEVMHLGIPNAGGGLLLLPVSASLFSHLLSKRSHRYSATENLPTTLPYMHDIRIGDVGSWMVVSRSYPTMKTKIWLVLTALLDFKC